MTIQELEQELKPREGKRMIIQTSIVKERFDDTFRELPPTQPGQTFLKDIVEIGRIVASFGKPPIKPEEDEERGYSDTDDLFKRELTIPANGNTTLQAKIKLFRDIHESKITIEQVIPSHEGYDFTTCPKITLAYNNNGTVSLAVNPKDVENANDFETPIDIKPANYPREVDERDMYKIKNYNLREDESNDKLAEGDCLEISGHPYSLGEKMVEFMNKFATETLEAFRKLEAQTATYAKNQSNTAFTIYPN